MEPGEHRQALEQLRDAHQKQLGVLRRTVRNDSIVDHGSSSVGVFSLERQRIGPVSPFGRCVSEVTVRAGA
jgi:hypothetical protein